MAKYQKLTILIAGEDVDNRKSHSLRAGTTSWDNILQGSCEAKPSVIIYDAAIMPPYIYSTDVKTYFYIKIPRTYIQHIYS